MNTKKLTKTYLKKLKKDQLIEILLNKYADKKQPNKSTPFNR